MRVAFLGVGHLAGAMIEGILREGRPPFAIGLSPRGLGPELARRHGLDLAADNAGLVAGADLVVLAVRPRDAVGAVSGLPWRADHLLVSACAGVPITSLAVAARRARVMRIMPLTAAAIGASPTVVFPDLAEARPLLSRLGSVIPLSGEADFETATVSAAIYGWAQSLIGIGCAWSADRGLAPGTARRLAAETFVAAGRMIAERDEGLDDLLASLVTPGGITERGLEVLEDAGVADGWRAACDAVLAKLTSRPAAQEEDRVRSGES